MVVPSSKRAPEPILQGLEDVPVVVSARVLTAFPPVCSFAIAPKFSLYQPSYSQEQATQGLRYPDMLDMNASYDAYAPSHSTGDVQSFQVILGRLRYQSIPNCRVRNWAWKEGRERP